MKVFFLLLFTSVNLMLFAQFSTESQVVSYMSGKEFYSDSYQMTVSYEFIPKYNTYGIICVNKNNEKFYYINCNVFPYGSSADINGSSLDGGGNFGFRVYKDRISVQGENFYTTSKTQSNASSTTNSTQMTKAEEEEFAGMAMKSLFGPSKPATSEDIKKFQDWMDKSHPGWVNGKSLNKGTGYGSWGPSTQKAWEKYGSTYK
jgi:hypothetical protein